MKTFIHYLFILISVLTIASCENDLPFNVKDNPPKLVMNALINADSLTNIVFLNLTGKERVTHIQNATLEVRVNGVLTEQLRPLPIESEYSVPQCQFKITGKLSSGDVLRLDALTDDGQYHAWAEVTVPRRPAEIEKIDTLTSAIFEYADGKKAAFSCGMALATDLDRHIDRFEIQGTKGSIKGTGFEFNGDGELSYTITFFDGREEMKTISVPQNYRLEVEQMGRCVEGKETPAVTRGFSLANARMIDAILEEIGY